MQVNARVSTRDYAALYEVSGRAIDAWLNSVALAISPTDWGDPARFRRWNQDLQREVVGRYQRGRDLWRQGDQRQGATTMFDAARALNNADRGLAELAARNPTLGARINQPSIANARRQWGATYARLQASHQAVQAAAPTPAPSGTTSSSSGRLWVWGLLGVGGLWLLSKGKR